MKDPYILVNRKSVIAEIKSNARQILDKIKMDREKERIILEDKIKKLNRFQYFIEDWKTIFDVGLIFQLKHISYKYSFHEIAANYILQRSDNFQKLNHFMCKHLYLDDLWYSSKKYTT